MSPMPPQCRPRLARGVRIRTDPVSGDAVLLYPEGFLPLDETTNDILGRCSGDATLESIIDALAGEYDVEHATVNHDVRECLEELRRRMLVALVP